MINRHARTEREVMADVMKILRAWGIPHQRQNTGGFRNNSGQYVACGATGNADITATLPGSGRRLEIEVKRPGKRPTEAQLRRMREHNAAGAVAFWVDNAEDLPHALGAILTGARVEIHADGTPYLVTPEPRSR